MPLPTNAHAAETEDATASPAAGTRHGRRYECDKCGEWFDGEPAGAGLFLWTRGEEVRYEEPPLCEECASEITVGALVKWESEDEEEG
ncbi:MAG TPA: hypothetical protein VGQ57_07150 [Polyangiaceae bacterium]|jgi:predicted RNA-binding Zn-ribbon protein involved in translation (DUF1610 family)|nr:hypothetical protein [Polyangiaceae bacterium]